MSNYFLYHSIGTFPSKADRMAEALSGFSRIWAAEDDGQWPAALTARQRFIEAWSQLIAAPAGSLTTAENCTTALYSLMGALPPEHLRGKTLLVAGDCFPSLHFLLAGLAEQMGFQLRTVPLRAGEYWVRDEDVLAQWTPDVGVALLTLVSSTSSHRIDVERLLAHGRAMGSLVGLDVTQGVGVVPVSVAQWDVDFLVSTSLKWLCGVSGAGVLYVAPRLLAQCAPRLRGWFSQENPFSWDLDAFQYAGDARRFDHGTPAILAAVASQPGLDWVLAQGVDSLRAQNLKQSEAILLAARDAGLQLASPLKAEERGGSVMLALPHGTDAQAVVANLRTQAIYCDARGRILRLSPGSVTSPNAVETLFAALHPLLTA